MGITSPAALAALLALALAPGRDAAAAAGQGLRFAGGVGRVHPFLEVEARYDTDVAWGAGPRSVEDLVLHVRPGLEVSLPDGPVALELSGSVDRAQYLGVGEDDTSDLSRFYAEAGLALTVSPEGALGLELEDEFRRSPSTSAFVFGGAVVSSRNALRVAVPWRPGGGALEVALAGGWTRESFDALVEAPLCDPAAGATCDDAALGDLGHDELRGGAEVRWKFLPRTSAVLEATLFSRDPADAGLADEVSGVEATAGVTGLFTPRLGGTVRVGYGSTLGALDEDVSTLLATVELEWSPARGASIRAGYGRGLGVDPGRILSVPAVYTADRLTAGVAVALGRRVSARAEGSWEERSYELAPSEAEASLLVLEPSLEAVLAPWMTASLGYTYTDRGSSLGEGTAEAPGLEYAKSEAWLRLAVRY